MEDCKRHLKQFFTEKDNKTFCKDGVINLLQRLQRIVEQKSKYVFQIKLMSKVKRKKNCFLLLVNKQDELSK